MQKKIAMHISLLSTLAILAVSLVSIAPSQANEDSIRARKYGDTTREAIIETRNRRKRHFKLMLLNAQKKLSDFSTDGADHDPAEKLDLERSIDLYQQKVDQLEIDLEEWVRHCRIGTEVNKWTIHGR